MGHEQWLEQHDRMIADLDGAMAESQENHDREMAEIREQHMLFVADVGRMFLRAIRLGVREVRKQRPKRGNRMKNSPSSPPRSCWRRSGQRI